jgi:hypothetical protein
MWRSGARPRPHQADLRAGTEDGVGIDAIDPVKVADGACLAEMLDAEGMDPVTHDRAEPSERCRMTIDHGDERRVWGEGR